jgi:hypothetical protein
MLSYVYSKAYQLWNSKRVWRKLKNQDAYIFSSNWAKIQSATELCEAYTRHSAASNWDEFVNYRFMVQIISDIILAKIF